MRIGVVGCAGRMGTTVLRQVLASGDLTLAGAVEREGAPAVGGDVGPLAGGGPMGIAIGADPAPLFAEADAVIDFTTPDATTAFAALAAQGKTVHVVGTTGLGPAHEEALAMAARHTAIVRAPNMSLGVNLLLALVERVAAALDDGFDIEVVEMHHRHKVDAPSGTALALGRAAAAGRGVVFDEHAVLSREGRVEERRRGDIGFATLRGGDVVGEHTVLFAGPEERIELTHRAASRDIFARGALQAARWAHGRPPGLYGMRDVLGL
jgi:4-hydroxy-tetrahydrodipicolinate reductase